MSTSEHLSRIDLKGTLDELLNGVVAAYALGDYRSHSVIESGYEDCNIHLETSGGDYLVKAFAKTRQDNEIKRYVEIVGKVAEVGVNHPTHHRTKSDELVYRDASASLVVMDFITGQTFLDNEKAISDQDLDKIVHQAALINQIDFKPNYLFDSWAIPNIYKMYENVTDHLAKEDKELLDQAIERFKQIPLDELPHAFVHGDIIKGNAIKSDEGEIYILDFSVANWYPRIQEIAVMASSLLGDRKDPQPLQDRLDRIVMSYEKSLELVEQEHEHLYDYALAGVAMELMGGIQEKHLKGRESDENDFWLELGREGLQKELNDRPS